MRREIKLPKLLRINKLINGFFFIGRGKKVIFHLFSFLDVYTRYETYQPLIDGNLCTEINE